MQRKLNKKMICDLLSISLKSYYRWRDNRKIFNLLEKYFSDEDLKEFLETGKIQKFDNLTIIHKKIITLQAKKYINAFLNKTESNTIKFASPYFIDFYFSFLVQFNKLSKTENINNFAVNKKSFQTIINSYFINYIFKKQNTNQYEIEKFKIINSYLYIFNDWDELMNIFLLQAIENNFSDLYLTENISLNQIIREEIYIHVIGLYVYKKYYTLAQNLKVNLIKHLSARVKEKYLGYNDLIDFIQSIEEETIKTLIDLGFDKYQ